MNIIVFYCDVEWNIFNRREFIQEVALQLPSWQVVVINRPAAILPNCLRPKKYKAFQEAQKLIYKEEGNIKFIRPLTLFHDQIGGHILSGWGNLLLKKSIDKKVRKLCEQEGCEINKIYIWLYEQPQWIIGNILNEYNKKVIWEIFDDYRLTAQGDIRPMWVACEKNMLKVTDHILTLTNNLKNKYIEYGIPITTIGNGYSKEIFYPQSTIPTELDGLNNIVMYLGVIRDWIDFELVKTLVETKPYYNIVFVGPVEKNVFGYIEALKKYDNFVHIGKQERNHVAQYMSAAKVAIIPYLKNDFTKSVKPIKLYEFLSCGTPVITTTNADIESYPGAIYCGNSAPSKFIADIDNAMLNLDIELCINLSKPWSWESVVTKTFGKIGIN